MSELLILGLLFGGGFVLALLFLLSATFGARSRARRGVLCGLAFAALVAQGGCWMTAMSIGGATGGGGGSGGLLLAVVVGFLVAFLWTSVLLEKRENDAPQLNSKSGKPTPKEEIHCLECGALLQPEDRTCKACGWTWK